MIKLVLLTLLTPLLTACLIKSYIQGSGTVTSVPAGNFACTNNTGDCQQQYTAPGTQALKAEAGPGHTFAKWTNCPFKSIDECQTLPWNQDLANSNSDYPITATFKPKHPPVQIAQYTYNALGQRITKKVGNQVTIFQYDLDGNLMAEIDAATGQALRQHVHVNGEPMAQLTTNPADGTLSVQYVHTDHLGTPTLLTNQSGVVVADIEAEPFGETYIDYAELTHNRRFPGQYKDEETGLHYNYFRDYDPTTGRYIQSDPVGLGGGLNTYAYAYNSPIDKVDPYGLWVKICARWLGNEESWSTWRINPTRHDYLNVSGHSVGFYAAGNPFWKRGKLRHGTEADRPSCKLICEDDKFDKYVNAAAQEIGAPTYSLIASAEFGVPGLAAEAAGARNCQSWARDVLARAKRNYLAREECPKCFQ